MTTLEHSNVYLIRTSVNVISKWQRILRQTKRIKTSNNF